MTDLWTCPDCGRQFANRNQVHSCVTTTIDEALAEATPIAVELYEAIEGALRACGHFRSHPQQTRIAFITTMTFASVRLASQWVDLALITAQPIDDDRISGVDLYGPTSFASEVRIRSVTEVDDDVGEWLCAAYQRGLQETLDPTAAVEPVVGSTLERLRVPLASKIVETAPSASLRPTPRPPNREETDLGLSVPRYALQAFEAHPEVIVRVAGTELPGVVGDGFVIADVVSLGLGVGDSVDITLRADL